MRRLTDTTTPIGGLWTYTQPETGVVLRELHWNAFLKKIRDHRLANGIPVTGEFVPEIHDAVAKSNPRQPSEEIGKVERYYTQDDIHRFVVTMKELRKSDELVSPEEHKRRVGICINCPRNGVIMGCKFCTWLAQQTTELMAGRSIPRAPEVVKRSCMACGCDIASKTAVPLAVLKQVDEKLGITPDYDPRCWMLEEAPST